MGCTATALLGVVASRSPLRSAGCSESSGPTLTGATVRQQRSLAPGLSALGRAMAALAMHKLLPLKTQRGEVICVCSQSRVPPACMPMYIAHLFSGDLALHSICMFGMEF